MGRIAWFWANPEWFSQAPCDLEVVRPVGVFDPKPKGSGSYRYGGGGLNGGRTEQAKTRRRGEGCSQAEHLCEPNCLQAKMEVGSGQATHVERCAILSLFCDEREDRWLCNQAGRCVRLRSPEMRRATEGVATYLATIEKRFAGIETRLAAIDAKLTLLTWTLGVNIAMVAAVLAKLLH